MIKTAAKYCKVDVVKFQKRNNKELLSPTEYSNQHPVPENSYGKLMVSTESFWNLTLNSILA